MKFTHLMLPALSIAISVGCQGKNRDTEQFIDRIPDTDRFPVVAWHGVRAEHATEERFKEAENMGITINYSRMGNVETALKALDEAARTNVKLIIECDELYNSSKRRDAVRALMNHPALEGYFCADEPRPDKFGEIATMMNEIRLLDTEHICYANLFPTGGPDHYAALGVKDYREYVQKYLDTCPATFLSFDKYPVVNDGTGNIYVLAEWYQALEIASDEARKHGFDLWTFMLTCPHTSYPQPTVDHLRLQAYSNLAYGSQVLQCFTYWTPEVADPEFWNYRNAPIEEDGTRTETYDIVKSVLDEIQTVAWIFEDCTVEGVWHLAPEGTVPTETKELTEMPEMVEDISVADEEKALVSILKNHGYTFLLFQNTDVNNACRSYIKMKPGARCVMKDGSVVPAEDVNPMSILSPGDVRIYMWK